jgi:flagellar basal body P-ring formation protein FlgA
LGVRLFRGPPPPPPPPPPTMVTVRAAATVTEPRVLIRDVAEIEGGSQVLREQIARLDLSDLPTSNQPAVIHRGEIFFRLRLAGIDSQDFRLQGATQVQVSLARYQVTEHDVLAAAKRYVLQHFPGDADDISIQPVQPLRSLPTVTGSSELLRLDVEPQSSGIPLGKICLNVIVLVNGEKRGLVPAWFHVKFSQRVAVCKRRIERGELLTGENVYFDQRTLDSLQDYVTTPQALAGKRARRALSPGQVLIGQDLESASTEDPILVKQQGLVKLVAKLGPVQIVADCEALQDGRKGQLIRVRNIDSRNIVVGRVVDRSLVEAEY